VAPLGQVTFWVYLLIGVVLLGGLGVWIEALIFWFSTAETNSEHIRIALITFFPALVGSTSLELIFADTVTKPVRAFAVLCGFMCFGLATWLGVERNLSTIWAFPIASLASLAAIWIWWIAHGLDDIFYDHVDGAAAVGGDPTNPPVGSLDNFRH